MKNSIAILASGGLDSSVLLADMAKKNKVYPLYVRTELLCEKDELKALETFIKTLNNPNIQPITTLAASATRLYKKHWSVTGTGIPSLHSPDGATFLPGRNILLLSLGAIWCSLHNIPKIAIASLKGNHFPDATPTFFKQFSKILSSGLGFHIEIEAPYRKKYTKENLIQQHATLPLELTITCLAPKQGRHCGNCNKCRERQVGFQSAGISDQTKYIKKSARI